MKYQYRQHYTREEARALLPQVREWLKQLEQLREDLVANETILLAFLQAHPGKDTGGSVVNTSVRLLAQIKALLGCFESRDIQIKDLDRGLLDFPALIDGREVFLCWEKSEDDIEFWHDLDSGYAGREPL